jgi:hypothetical protein
MHSNRAGMQGNAKDRFHGWRIGYKKCNSGLSELLSNPQVLYSDNTRVFRIGLLTGSFYYIP